MNILMGIGNEDKGDDGVGVYVAKHLQHPDWLGLDCATTPENFTGVVRRHHPEKLLLVDAAQMGLAPGAIRRIGRDRIEDVGFSTHMLPLYHLIDYLQASVGEITFIGIQPKSTGFDESLSGEVRRAAEEIMDLVRHDLWSSIPDLKPET